MEIRRDLGTFVVTSKITQSLARLTGFCEDMQAVYKRGLHVYLEGAEGVIYTKTSNGSYSTSNVESR